MNRNLIIVGVVVVALLGSGVAFYFLNGNNNTNTNTNSPAPVAKTGELTRELARQIVWEQLKVKSVRNGELKNITITGITKQSETTAMVNFIVEYENIAPLELTMPLALYDDGWKSFGW